MSESNEKKACHVCLTENQPEASFCMMCGAKLGNAVCPNCGTEAEGRPNFCIKCGYCFNADAKLRQNLVDSAFGTPKTNENINFQNQSIGNAEKSKFERKRVRDKAKTAALTKIICSGVTALLFVIIFALSFCQIAAADSVYYYVDGANGQGYEFDYKLELKAVDMITLMLDSAKSNDAYQTGELSASDEKLRDRILELQADLQDSIDLDISHGLLRTEKLSAKSVRILNKLNLLTMRLGMGQSVLDDTGNEVNIVFAGIACLMMMVASLAMAVVSIVSFAVSFKNQNAQIHKYAFFTPGLLGLAITALLVCGGQVGSAYAALVALCVLISAGYLTYAVIKAIRNKEGRRIVTPLVSLGLTFITIGCLSAPFYSANVSLTPAGRTNSAFYNFKYDSSFSTMFVISGDWDKKIEEMIIQQSDGEWYENTMKTLEVYRVAEIRRGEADEAVSYVLILASLRAKEPAQMRFLASSYYLSFFLALGLSVLLGLCGAFLFTKAKSVKIIHIVLRILCCLLALIVLAVTGICVWAISDAFDYLNYARMEMHIGAGSIVVALFAIVTAALPLSFKSHRGQRQQNQIRPSYGMNERGANGHNINRESYPIVQPYIVGTLRNPPPDGSGADKETEANGSGDKEQ